MSFEYINILYDYYGDLLTPLQKEYFEAYYFNNLSLSEISENYNVSRNAVHRQLKIIEEKLNYYEDKLGLYKKGLKIEKLIEGLDEDLKNKIKELI